METFALVAGLTIFAWLMLMGIGAFILAYSQYVRSLPPKGAATGSGIYAYDLHAYRERSKRYVNWGFTWMILAVVFLMIFVACSPF